MSKTYGERLAQALQSAGKTRAELAGVLRRPDGSMGISVSAVGQVLAGTSKSLTAENSALAARFLGVSHLWLALGVGPMQEAPTPLRTEEPAAPYGLTDMDVLNRLGLLLSRCPAPLRPAVADLLAAWARDGAREDRAEAICSLLGCATAQV